MSILFGIWQPEGHDVYEQQLLELSHATRRFAPDGTSVLASGKIGMGFQPYHTHQRSNIDPQPTTDKFNNMIAFDGRLDNHAELCQLLDLHGGTTADSVIILAAFLRWGDDCFSRFIGDWALSLWCPSRRRVYLARDHAGTRNLHFHLSDGVLRWSTFLDTFFAHTKTYPIEKQYALRYLTGNSVRDFTPYAGIRTVLPAHYYIFDGHSLEKKSHWGWVSKDQIRYKSDTEYEEHFFSLFRQSVVRRTVHGAPVLAQLSGGMDSTSIVCMSDHVRRLQMRETDLLDTVSFFDNSEPNWNEFPYFSAVETGRGKTGLHLETTFSERTLAPVDPERGLYLLPGSDSSTLKREDLFTESTKGRGYRVVLSGIGGDELLGGVPTGTPELADHLRAGNLPKLFNRAVTWALVERTPVLHVLFDAIAFSINLYTNVQRHALPIPPYLPRAMADECNDACRRDGVTTHTIRDRPSSQNNGLAWWGLMETLPHLHHAIQSRLEYRYPYLDRELVDFLFSVPREQIVRPNQRRSLMRRALKNIVPPFVLNRRRKAFLIRGPLAILEAHREQVDQLFARSLTAGLGFIDQDVFRKSLLSTTLGRNGGSWPLLMQAILFEVWLQAWAMNQTHSVATSA